MGARLSERFVVWIAVLAAFGLVFAPVFGAGAQGVDAERLAGDGHAAKVRVMTRNLYLGADLAPAFAARTPAELIAAVTGIYATVLASNFPDRAQALADEIVKGKPDFVGLQEAELWRSQTPADFSPVPNANRVEFDFVQILLDALAARGRPYAVVGMITNFDAEAPRAIPGGFQDVRLTDRDVLIVRADHEKHLSIANVHAENFRARLTITTAVLSVTVPRGWVSADVTEHGKTFRLVTTHLEALHPVVNTLQGDELLAGPAATTLPVIVIGDLNSAADGSSTPTYANFVAAGFVDAWAVRHPNKAGYTCCEAEDLRNPTPTLTERIDFVLFKGAFRVGHVWLVGENSKDRTPSGLWPSDHAGVGARLKFR